MVDEYHKLLVQWKSSTELKRKDLKETPLHEMEKKCENPFEDSLWKEKSKLDARKLEYEDELLRHSKELAVIFKGKSLPERRLQQNFTFYIWEDWTAKYSHATPPLERLDINAEIKDFLLGHFKEEHFRDRIRSFPKDTEFSLDLEEHIMKKTSIFFFTRRVSNADVINLQYITDNIIACVKANIDKKEQQKRGYSRNFINEILNEVEKGVNSVPSSASCTFTREYIVDLSLYLCSMAAERFKAMHEEFQKANDPFVYLKSRRRYYFQCFQISCQEAPSLTTFAGFFCETLAPAVQQAVYERTAKALAQDMQGKIPDFWGNRANLEVYILRYLAEQENFEYFKQYLNHPKEFFQSYIETRVQSFCLYKRERLQMFLESSLDLLYRIIQSAVCFANEIDYARKDREDKISRWLDEFCRKLRDVISLPRSDLRHIEHHDIDIEFLSSAMAKAVDNLRNRLRDEFIAADMSSLPRQPHTILAEHFSGCWEQCPFCGAVCTNSIEHHDGAHHAVFHRPRALMGNKWCGSDQLILEDCTMLVASKHRFRLRDRKWIRYKRYWDAGPPFDRWIILPDPSMQAYWKWFVCHFSTELAALYNGKFRGKGEIPEAWWRISKQEALSELDKC